MSNNVNASKVQFDIPNLLNDPNLRTFDIPAGESVTNYRVYESYRGGHRAADIQLVFKIDEAVIGSKFVVTLGYRGDYFDNREYVITNLPYYIEFGTGNVQEVLISASGPMKGMYAIRPYCAN